MPTKLNRRELIKMLGVGGVAGLAGCYNNQGGSRVPLMAGGGSMPTDIADAEIVMFGPNESLDSYTPDTMPAYAFHPNHGWLRWE